MLPVRGFKRVEVEGMYSKKDDQAHVGRSCPM